MATDREKALDVALGAIEKQFGTGAIMRMGEGVRQKIAVIPTGAIGLDLALGTGGFPRGRVCEIFGPESSGKTTVALHAIAEAQKQGGIAAFIDAEHALDPTYAAALGVDVDALLVSQPDTGEQALEITDTLVRSGAIDLLVIDSVAALTPRAEIEGEMGDTHVGLQARLMSQALRKLAGHLNRSRTCCIFINQLREKIGVMFGCFHFSTRVTLADGTQEMIGKLVNERRDVEVLSYNPETGAIEPRKIVNWYDNGPTDEFLQFTVASHGGNGRSQFAATPNHLISTPVGWVPAGEIAVGDRVLQKVTTRLSVMQREALLGTLMGAGSLTPSSSGLAARYRFGHGVEQTTYADWKASLWHNIPSSRSTTAKRGVRHAFTALPELADLPQALYWPNGKMLSYDYLKALTPLSLALWYCDNGSLAEGSDTAEIFVQAIEPGSRLRLRDHLADTFAVHATLGQRDGQAVLQFPSDQTAKLQELIAPYVHPSMEHKLLPRFRGSFAVTVETVEPRDVLAPMPVTDIHRKPPNRATHRFDLEIEGNANYFVDGVMVHNSPETTPGGRALKFYASVRLDIRRIESLKDGQDFVGNRVRVKVVKNKLAPPFRKTEFDIMFGEGISKEGSLLDIGVEHGIVRKAGAWYTYDGEQLGQGRENARGFLKEHGDVADEIYKKTTELLGLVQTDVTGDDVLAAIEPE
ncbi:MAG: recombinase RecA [Euzebya sp.]